MAARRWGWLVGRIVLVGLLRLPLTQIHQSHPDLWLYHLMLAPLALGGVLAVPVLGWIDAGSLRWARPRHLAQVARYAGVNWLASLASQAPQFVLPLVVAQSVASAVNANFFLAWTVTGLVFLVPAAIAQVLLVEGSKDAEDTASATPGQPDPRRAREALLFSLGLASVAWFAAFTLGAVVTFIFGDAYRSTARLLPGLLLAGIPWAITSVRLSEARVRRDQVATVAITLTLGLGILVPTLLFVPTQRSTLAASRSWLAGNLAAAVVAVLAHERARRSMAAAT
jgi:O-antigen/teichoic acid export membrane protein